MGYRTYYTLSVYTEKRSRELKPVDDERLAAVIDMLRVENEDARYALDGNGHAASDASWHGHESEMVAFSLKYPDLVFELAGMGDENEDIWTLFFKNGRTGGGHVKFVYPTYKRAKMKALAVEKEPKKVG